jgi:hypothetical protein
MSTALRWSRAQVSSALLIPVTLLMVGCGDNSADDVDDAPAAETDETVAANPHLNAADLCALVPASSVAEAAGGVEPLSSAADAGPPASSTCRRRRFRAGENWGW